MRIFRIFIVLLISSLFVTEICYSKAFLGPDGHQKDICICLGVNDKSCQAVTPTLKFLSQTIDIYNNNLLYELKKEFNFNKGKYSHRILFHWGFNDHPQTSEALRERVEASVDKTRHNEFYDYLIKRQKERNGKMIAQTQKDFCIKSRERAGAFTTIVYDIHILGDYSTKEISTLAKLYKIKQDVKERGIKRLFPYSGERQSLISKLDRESIGGNDSETAQRMLTALKEGLPPLFSRHWKELSDLNLDVDSGKAHAFFKYLKGLF